MALRCLTTTPATYSDKDQAGLPLNAMQPTLSAWLMRPYIDLEGPGGSIQARTVAYTVTCLANEAMPQIFSQGNTRAGLRDELVRECGLPHYHLDWPEELPTALRTAHWQILCDALARWSVLDYEQKSKVTAVLGKLGLYKAVLHAIPRCSAGEIASSEEQASLALKRVNALFKLDAVRSLQEVEEISGCVATSAPGDGRTRLRAALNLVVHYARSGADSKKNLPELRTWVEVAQKEFACLQPERFPVDHLYASMYYRGVSFLPYHTGDRETVASMLDEAELHAQALFEQTSIPEAIAAENLHALLETRAKEARWAGNYELALVRLRKLVELDPLEPKVYIRLGDVLFGQKRFSEALPQYQQAARLGAPSTSSAWFKVGECYRHLEESERACDSYVQAVKCDPWNIPAFLQLYRVSRQNGNHLLRTWSEERLQHFHRQAQSGSLAQV